MGMLNGMSALMGRNTDRGHRGSVKVVVRQSHRIRPGIVMITVIGVQALDLYIV